MRKTERIDQVLIRLGYVTPADITSAVARQKKTGGRIGRSLVEMGSLTEEQLFDALVEQFRVPTISVDERSVPEDLLRRMPARPFEESLIVPLEWNPAQGVLSIAVANPSDQQAIDEVREAFGARKVRVSLAPETLLRQLVGRLGGASTEREPGRSIHLVALPELFEPELAGEGTGPAAVAEPAEPTRRGLVVSGAPVMKNFLPAVVGAEGYAIEVVSTPAALADAMDDDVDVLLVADDLADEFEAWIEGGAVRPPACEVVRFASVGASLVDNPASYTRMVGSVRAAVLAVSEYRCTAEGVSPPYALMAQDLEALGVAFRISRLARDGLFIGLHLLMPVEAGTRIDPFRSFANSLEIAHRLRFPWSVEGLLRECLRLFVGSDDLTPRTTEGDEIGLAAQLLALVWFRHNLLQLEADEPAGAATESRLRLREVAGRLAALDVVEAYLGQLGDRGGPQGGGPLDRAAILVGGDRVERVLVPALGRVGVRTEVAANMTDAQSAVSDRPPAAVVVDHAVLEADLTRICRMLRVDRRALLFVLTDEADPALVLNLLDIGVDDVFGPPHDFDLVAARIHRAVRARSSSVPGPSLAPGQLSARFDAMSFIDLTQMLANALKTVRVDLRRGDEDAVLYFRRGRPVHARAGSRVGPGAVYDVLAWEDDGEFSVHEVSTLPEQNIDESIESLLMEGVRILDESRAQ